MSTLNLPLLFNINTDGGSRGNPGPGAAGFVIKDRAGNVQEKCGKYLGLVTNNVAEYHAVLEALKKARLLLPEQGKQAGLNFYIDSQLVVNQLSGNFKIKSPHLRVLIDEIKKEAAFFGQVSFQYIPREQNMEADAVVNRTLDERIT